MGLAKPTLYLRKGHGTYAPSGFKWIADVGFSPRVDACGGGPILKVELMQKCVDLNIEIYLSEYTEDDDI